MGTEEKHPTGKWVDLKTGQVVDSQPEEGVQLVPEGGVMSPDVERSIRQAEEVAAGTFVAPDVVTTETAEAAPATETATKASSKK